MATRLVHVHPDGFKEKVVALKEYRTYPVGASPHVRWALVMRPRKGPRQYQLVPLAELVIET